MRVSADAGRPGGGVDGNGLILASVDFPPRAGGIQQVCLEVSRALCRLGVGVHVFAPSQPGDVEFDRNEPYAVTRHRAGRTREPVPALALLRALRDKPSPVLPRLRHNGHCSSNTCKVCGRREAVQSATGSGFTRSTRRSRAQRSPSSR
jgi:hypothetical protein